MKIPARKFPWLLLVLKGIMCRENFVASGKHTFFFSKPLQIKKEQLGQELKTLGRELVAVSKLYLGA